MQKSNKKNQACE